MNCKSELDLGVKPIVCVSNFEAAMKLRTSFASFGTQAVNSKYSRVKAVWRYDYLLQLKPARVSSSSEKI